MSEPRQNSTLGFLGTLMLAVLLIAGCSGSKPVPDGVAYSNGQEVSSRSMDPKSPEYIIGMEDVLDIAIWKNPELSKVVTVRPDGMISLPLIGDIRAAGKTPLELRDEITERLKEYQETVVASVMVKEVRSYRIFVLGEVLNPGSYVMMRKTSVLQAIALAGGFNEFASRNRITLIREHPDNWAGDDEKIRIRFDDIVDSGGLDGSNMILKPGDTIFVP